MKFPRLAGLVSFAIGLMPMAAGAEPKQAALTALQSSKVAGWDNFIAGANALPDEILKKLPPNLQNDPQVQQEVGRLALAAITSQALQTLGSDGDHPLFLASLNLVLNAGQPNADTIIRTARITPGGSYRLRGFRGTARIVKISQAGPGPGEPGAGQPAKTRRLFHDFDALKLDKDGRYDVLLSPERPFGYTGDWWPLQRETAHLILRAVSSDWTRERDPTISIERVDVPATRPRPSAEEMQRQLMQLPKGAEFLGTMLVDYIGQLESEGYVHRFKGRGPREGGLGEQFYYESVFDLKQDEALIVEVNAPTQCKYRSLMLTNEIEQAIDWYNNQSSLNDAQAPVDKDGILRIVVSPKDPAVPNWLDTAGHSRGMIQGRWTECNAQPVPTARKVALSDVRRFLAPDTPVVTPAERDRQIRERRAAFQQRPLW